jgi:RNA polymerase sigma factor (sigma-70 family)
MLEAAFREAYPLARRAAQVQAAAAIRSSVLPYGDRGDLEQDGLLAFWRSLPFFDPSKASIRTFAERAIRNRIVTVMRAHRASRRLPVTVQKASFEDFGGSIELRIDVRRVLRRLNKDDRRLAWLLAEHSPSEASRIVLKSRSTVYEGIRRIRVAFVEAGLDAGREERPIAAVGRCMGARS